MYWQVYKITTTLPAVWIFIRGTLGHTWALRLLDQLCVMSHICACRDQRPRESSWMPLIPGLQAWHVAQKALDILLSFCVTFFFWMSGIFKATLFYVTFFFSILPSSHFHCLFVSRELLKPMDFFLGGSTWSRGSVQEGFHTWSHLVTSTESLNSAAFLCWHFLPLWAHSYWLLRAQMGAGEGELLNAKDIWPPPHSIPLSTSLLFLSPAHKYYTRMHTHTCSVI